MQMKRLLRLLKLWQKNFNIDVKMSEFIATNMHKSDNKENENEYIKNNRRKQK